MPMKIHSKSQMRQLFALGARGELKGGVKKAEEMARAEGHKRLMRLPEKAEEHAAGGKVGARSFLEHGPSAASACPKCGYHFAEGGEVDDDADAFDRNHEIEMGQADRTREYDRSFRHVPQGEAGLDYFARGGRFAEGGEVDLNQDFSRHAKEDAEEDKAEYGRMTSALAPQGTKRMRQDTSIRSRSYAHGGAAGNDAGYTGDVCAVHESCSGTEKDCATERGTPTSAQREKAKRKRMEPKPYAHGGTVDFANFLAKSKDARRSYRSGL